MVVLTMCGCAVLCLWLCGCCVLRGVGVVCCTTCVRDCVCWWLLCVVPLCVHVVGVCVGHVCDCVGMVGCVYACLCDCVWLVWRDGVWVSGSGCVVMAWGWWLRRGHVCVCRGCGVCLCVAVVYVCVRCGVVCVVMLCGRCCWRRRLVWMHVYCVG